VSGFSRAATRFIKKESLMFRRIQGLGRQSARVSLMAVVLSIATTPSTASASPFFFAGNGHWYEAVDDVVVNWADANADAESRAYWGMQGYLVTITSAAENLFVSSLLPDQNTQPNPYYWMGAYQSPSEFEPGGGGADANWHWITGEAWDWTNWDGGEPNNANGNEERVHISFFSTGDGRSWNDNDGVGAEMHFVVEYDAAPVPEPATLLMIVAGLTAVATRRFAKGTARKP
jgi:hypothetical protein